MRRRGSKAYKPTTSAPSAASRSPAMPTPTTLAAPTTAPVTALVPLPRSPSLAMPAAAELIPRQVQNGSTPIDAQAEEVDELRNVVVMECMSGGAGLSTLSAMLALDLHQRGMSCALVDADFRKGGLDVLLGLENDKGLRFGTLQIPLGRVSGSALRKQLPKWSDIYVLAFDPWNSEIPEWWDVQAVVKALARVLDVVVVDAALGEVLHDVPDLARAQRVVVTEMSVVGVARSRMLLNAGLSRSSGLSNSSPEPVSMVPSSALRASENGLPALAVIGIEPRGVSRGRGVIDLEEACLYLGREVIGPVKPDAKLASDLLEGLGVTEIPKGAKVPVHMLADCICEQLKEGGRG